MTKKQRYLHETLHNLINQYSILEILIELKNLCRIGAKNNPGFGYEKDADTLSAAVEKIIN